MRTLFYKSNSYISLLIVGFLILFFVFSATPLFAKVGVGMGSGEINLTEGVKPGVIYALPSLRIFNTGDETTTYGMDIAFHQDYPQLRPGEGWFTFSPETFTLAAGESQEVKVTMTVPVKTEPGDYFAFIESGPVPSGKPGTSVGVAVATKLFFTVVPANILQAILYRVSSLFSKYSPWSWVGLGGVVCIIVFVFFRRFLSFNISIRKK